MSMRAYCICGYGFVVAVSDEALKDFILNHKKTVETLDRGPEILKWIEEQLAKGKSSDGMQDEFADYESKFTTTEGLCGLIADVMSEETGIRFRFERAQDNDEEYILLHEGLPWYYNEVERNLSETSLKQILKGYIEELNRDKESVRWQMYYPGRISLEFFG